MDLGRCSRLYHRLRRGEEPDRWDAAWPEARRILALLAREGRLPTLCPRALGLPPGRLHEALGPVLGNLPWSPRAAGAVLDRLEGLLASLPHERVPELHFGCCLRPAESAAVLPGKRLRGLLEHLEGLRGPAGPGSAASWGRWRDWADGLLRGTASGPAEAAGLDLARRLRRGAAAPRGDAARARASLTREASLWDRGARLAQALLWMERLPAVDQAALLLERSGPLLRGLADSGEPGLVLAARGAAPGRRHALRAFWREALQARPELEGAVLRAEAAWLEDAADHLAREVRSAHPLNPTGP